MHRRPTFMNDGPIRQTAIRFNTVDLDEVAKSNPRASLVDQVFALIASRSSAPRSTAGTKLPSVRQLAEDCNLSRDTVARAYEKLVAHGIVDARRGSGYYVKAGSKRQTSSPSSFAMAGPAANPGTRFRALLVGANPALISRTGSGSFPDNWQDDASLSGAMREVSRQSARILTQYGESRGYLPLRQQLQVKLQELGIHVDPGQVLVTAGATEGIHLVCQALIRPHSTSKVLIEDPCSPLLIDRLLSTGMDFLEVPRLADGPDLDVMRQLCREHKAVAFFCSSVQHNPTATQIAPHKAFQLLQLADEFQLTIVEDDTYGDLYSGGQAVSRLATLDQLKRVIYISSFSKTVAPGLRSGFIAASPERMDWLTVYRLLQSVSGAALSERVLYKVLSGGSYRRHCEQLRKRLSEVRGQVVAEAERAGLIMSWEPDSGMFLWASLGEGINALSVAERMYELGHLIAPGNIFSASPAYRSYIRINIAEASENSMFPALATLLNRRF
jgi:DNA-binding transcriptional MocR family regulator